MCQLCDTEQNNTLQLDVGEAAQSSPRCSKGRETMPPIAQPKIKLALSR